jgi:periplasmic protein TonB
MYQLLSLAVTAAFLSNPTAGTPAHAASCTVDHSPAAIARNVIPDYPEFQRQQGITGTSVIRVDLSETGSVLGSYVARSSGNDILDRAAVKAAKSMEYVPETNDCKGISGSYAVEVIFE